MYCLGGLLAAFVAGGFLNYFLQVRFVITTVIAVVILTTAMLAIILATEAETTGAGAEPRLVDWRLISASTVLILFAVLILTALALACSTRLELLPTLAICSAVLFLGLMSDWLFLEPGGGRVLVGFDPLHRDSELAELLACRCTGRGWDDPHRLHWPSVWIPRGLCWSNLIGCPLVV